MEIYRVLIQSEIKFVHLYRICSAVSEGFLSAVCRRLARPSGVCPNLKAIMPGKPCIVPNVEDENEIYLPVALKFSI